MQKSFQYLHVGRVKLEQHLNIQQFKDQSRNHREHKSGDREAVVTVESEKTLGGKADTWCMMVLVVTATVFICE